MNRNLRLVAVAVAMVLSSSLVLAVAPGTAWRQQVAPAQLQVLDAFPVVSAVALDADRTPTFVAGDLGILARGPVEDAAARFAADLGPMYRVLDREELVATTVLRDDLGQVHVKIEQSFLGRPIEGAEVYVHATERSGLVHAVSGRLFPTSGLPTAPWVDAGTAVADAVREAGILDAVILTEPALVYVVSDGKVHLAWVVDVLHTPEGWEVVDRVYADAVSSGLVAARAVTKQALYRKIYNANHTNPDNPNLPGTLMFTEGGSSSDSDAMAAYTNTGNTYNYYKARFNRDSYNNAGAQLISSVHLGTNYVNAYWTGTQMAFGDGDGVDSSSLAAAFDVVAHELTHAVTESSANLIYEKDPGALNEGMSDIFAAAAEAWKDGAVSADTWKIGEDCWTPATPGDALRYMNNPTADGYSKDYYPERLYASSCTPSYSNDYCGVHGNSGIANLAFYLLSQGGTHPRGKTTISVPAITIAKAEQVFYRALTYGYMTSTTTYEGARNATAQAATDLYTTTEVAAVQKCWDAVGVPGGAVNVTTLNNGQTVSNLSGATGSWAYYKITVPSGQSSLSIVTSGGTGDCDLYVKRGALPSSSSYDYRPYLNGNNETVTVSNPASGDWYIGLNAYSTFSGMSLKATYTGSTQTPTLAVSASPTTLSLASGASGTSTITTTVGGGFSSTVALSTSGVPSGASASLSKTSIAAPGSGTATLTVNAGTAAAGTYTITVTASGGGLTKTATVSLTITSSSGTGSEVESNNTTSTANVVSTAGTQLTAKIGSSTDVDYFKVTLPAGRTLTVDMVVPSTKDYDVKLYNSSGSLLASGTKGTGVAEHVTYTNTSTSSRVIYIKAYGYSGAYSTTLSYTIKFTW